MEILQLKYFCESAKSQNFSKTAKKFFVPTSGVSQSIKRLEKELGVTLFDHYSNKIYLNDDGRKFYDKVSRALELLETAEAEVSDKNPELSGDIKLVCLSNRRTVTTSIERFISDYPKVNFEIHHTVEANDNFDVLISDICPAPYSEKILIVDEEICIAMNKNHPLSNKRITVSDLEKERFITMPYGSSLYKIMVRICQSAGFTPDVKIQTDDPFYLRKYVEMGLGVALVPSKSWGNLFLDNVVIKSLGNVKRKTYAYLPQNKHVKKSVEKFLKYLTE